MQYNKIMRTLIILSMVFAFGSAMDCPADTAYHVDLRTMLPDGSPNPNYGQEIATGLCACLEFAGELAVINDTTVTLAVNIVDNEPIRGIEIDIYADTDELVYEGAGSVTKGSKLENVTDPNGTPRTMTLLANAIDDHVKVMAYSTAQAQTEGNGEEGDLVYVTYHVPNGVSSLPAVINFGIGTCNLPGTSLAPDLLNVVCAFPDTTNPQAVNVQLDVVEKPGIPTEYNLSQNYPNPFNPTTSIAFDIPQASDVTITIYNIIGQQVVSLVNDFVPAGKYEVEWNAQDTYRNPVASGVYFYELRSDDFTARKKMILLR